MKFLSIITVFSGLVAAAPIVDSPVAEKIESRDALLGLGVNLNLGTSSGPLLGVAVGSSTLLAVGGTLPKVSSAGTKKTSSVAVATLAQPYSTLVKTSSLGTVATAKASSTTTTGVAATTVTSAASAAYTSLYPSSFAGPAAKGVLSLTNLPALPPVLDQTMSGVLGAVYGLMSGICSFDYKCSISVAGTIANLLVDGASYGAVTTIEAWCDHGRCYGNLEPTLTATAPFTITCTYITGTQACSGTITGMAQAIFSNGKQLEFWGWITPVGYCVDGVCTASVKAFADPMY
ncbi:hypothetical protein LEMA_P037170.1 [Plenodomus lingam JN3]|uniref:Uncharacterized protein n=1 Tax=Leptosphaeria maculans (strain JN3 / isolate v23.1.3 / race Av1-4-5-6-7-8) TaxID=985895 RepID=E4ZQN8_LEPMJ|nr:hypothetical protein LEMA_P037170.1 [Plenodomus lingam JN3]CBX94043.1 hypothetical protein LEMA_P037170.1 [Plenodomus lingam JN3]